jgi:hypothetical protein
MDSQVKNTASDKLITGAEIVIRCINEEKVKFVFGYPGGAVLHIYDEFLFVTSKQLCTPPMHIRAPQV